MGTFDVKASNLMEAFDHFSVYIDGKSGHEAQPHEGADALVAGAQFVNAVQTIVSRNTDPQKSAVITIGRFDAGIRYNIVPGECHMDGTCRTFDTDVRAMVQNRMNVVFQGVCVACSCTGELTYDKGCCAIRNDAAMADYLRHTV